MEQNDSEQESIIFPQNSHIKADLNQQNISVLYRRKIMLKSHSPDNYQVIKICRRTTLTGKELKELFDEEVEVFSDEYSDQSSKEINEEQRNDISVTSIFEIMPSRADGNLFITLIK